MIVQVVYAKYEDRNHLLGFVSIDSNREDIESYFEEKQGYGLIIETQEVLTIPEGYARDKAEIEAKIEFHKKQICELENKIKIIK